jgi:hypothetical protein
MGLREKAPGDALSRVTSGPATDTMALDVRKVTMRLEIIIPDSTRPAVKSKLTSLFDQLRARPELVEEIHLNGDAEDAAIQKLFTPALLAEIDAAGADMKAGNRVSMTEVRERQAAIRAEWQAANPS